MSCQTCSPEITVKCIDGEEYYTLNIGGLAAGDYFVQITDELDNRYLIPFTFAEGIPVAIPASSLPEGLFSKEKSFVLEIVEKPGCPLPFTFTTCFTGIDLKTQEGIYYDTQIGEVCE